MNDETNQARLRQLAGALETGRLSRREFMGRAVALGASTALASSLATSAMAAATPKKGGEMRIGMGHGQTSDSLDPALLFNGYQWALAYAVRNTLTQVGPGGRLEPCLATAWTPSGDARQWTFELRKGVEFHDGSTLTAADVIASINHHRVEDSKSAVAPIAATIEELRSDGANTLVFVLESPNVDFPYSLAGANFTICKATAEGIDATSGIGTGGYVLKEFDPGVRAILERNRNYWRDDRAHADTIEFLSIPDSSARTSALLSDSLDVIDRVDIKVVDRLKQRPGIELDETQGPLHYLFTMLSNQAPFDDRNVRLALKHAVNREELLQKVMRGYGVLGNDQPIGPSYPNHDASLPQRSYDPDKVKFHLKKAGMESLSIKLSAADAAFAGAVDAATLFQQTALRAGIDVEIVREPNDGYWSDVYMKKPFFASYWGGYTTASEMLSTGYVPGAAWNDSFFENERFNELLGQAKAELDIARRRELYAEMQRIIHDESGQIIFAFPSELMAHNSKVAHGELAGDRGLDGRLLLERWWVV